jgi:glycosyltransferase involved in cell wall biosynthesis
MILNKKNFCLSDSVTVVIATYNGELYIAEQIRSILPQLQKSDEVIIVDDASTDHTLSVLKSIQDDRIKICCNDINVGPMRSFEKAIFLATGDLIFLSDQDDIWHSNKIKCIKEVYQNYSDITLVLSDARVVDDEGREILKSFYKMRGGFVDGVLDNLIKNRYLGCVMTFKKSMINKILPFPSLIPQHDMWIGLVNSVYGKTYYIPIPLIDYRRHNFNASKASSNVRSGLYQMIKWRIALALCLLIRVFTLMRQ